MERVVLLDIVLHLDKTLKVGNNGALKNVASCSLLFLRLIGWAQFWLYNVKVRVSARGPKMHLR
jgi:hypothetical protein